MEFISGTDGRIIVDPDSDSDERRLRDTQLALDFFAGNAKRVRHFSERAAELGRSGEDTVITLVNVDDPIGKMLADALMPGHDWQRYRDAGEIPVARGLAAKEGMPEFMEGVGFQVAADELRSTSDLRVLVIGFDTALVLGVEFSAEN